MLSYQHIYHAGGPADLHKHGILCAVLESLRARSRAMTYMETHAGRGLYDLESPESKKTGEAKTGWLAAVQNGGAGLPPRLVEIVRALNGGALSPLYPGSPTIASRMLRPRDRLHLMELHPREFAALEKNMADGERVEIVRRDGYEGVLERCPPVPRDGMVLIDPSYEIKEEYAQAADFIARLRNRWPRATVMLWYPLLPAARHVNMRAQLAGIGGEGASYHEYEWTEKDGSTGMYGSGVILLNPPSTLRGFRDLAALS